MNDGGIIKGALAAILEAGRDRFNTAFARSRRVRPGLDPEAFGRFLAQSVAPVADAVAGESGMDAAGDVVDELYETGLEVVGRNLFAREPALVEEWTRMLIAVAGLLPREPGRLARVLANVLHQLHTTAGARPDEWVATMEKLGPVFTDVRMCMNVGMAVAWQAGMAQYRESALDALTGLPPDVSARVLGLPVSVNEEEVARCVEMMRQDPWMSAESALSGEQPRRELGLVGRIGAFRGFGGDFPVPPLVKEQDGMLLVCVEEDAWMLHADRFGAVFTRAVADDNTKISKRPHAGSGFSISPTGKVKKDRLQKRFPEFAGITSAAATPATLAVTVPYSHAVLLVAAVEQ